MRLVHLTASRFFGGPERQMLGLAETLAPEWATTIVSFAEEGLCRDFLDRAQRKECEAIMLRHDTPRLIAAQNELIDLLRHIRPDALCCHGYKGNLLGLRAARRLAIPVVGVSRGWTGETWRVRLYERLDRWALKRMDRVVCVSEGQAHKVRRAGVLEDKIRVIHNAVRADRFDQSDPAARPEIEALFSRPPRFIVGAAGRLSPEKGFDVLIAAAARVAAQCPEVGFALFGDGMLRETLAEQIRRQKLEQVFVLAGFRDDLDRFFPYFDLVVLPSRTEGLPNVALEALAAGVPVVATAVGGTPEVVQDGVCGQLVAPDDPEALAQRIVELAGDSDKARDMGRRGRRHVEQAFSFDAQAEKYKALFAELNHKAKAVTVVASPKNRKTSPHPVRVCYVIDNLSRAGTESQLLMLISLLDRRQIEPYLCLLDGRGAESRSLEPCDCPVLRLGVTKLRRPATVRAAWRFARFLRHNRIDVVQTHFPDSTYFAVPVARAAGVRRIVLTRRNLGHARTRRDRWMSHLIRPLATATIANCEACRQAVIEQDGARAESVFVFPNAIDTAAFAHIEPPKASTNGRPRHVGMVANLRPVKGPDVFVRAAAIVARSRPNVVFQIAGAGDRESLLGLAAECGVADRLELLGRVDDVPAFLAGLDVAVLTSHSEGLSNALLEYMAAARPIVATAVGGNAELIDDGRTGFLVPPGDPEIVAQAVRKILADPALGVRLAIAVRRDAVTRHARGSLLQSYYAFYRRLASQE